MRRTVVEAAEIGLARGGIGQGRLAVLEPNHSQKKRGAADEKQHGQDDRG